jgi:hypothetical protein
MNQPNFESGILCTVKEAGSGVMAISSSTEGPCTHTPTSFWEILEKWQRTWMCDNLKWVGNNDWIAATITDGTCIAVTDGLYMKEVYTGIQSTALVPECTSGRGCLWCSFPEANHNACSYRGGLLGLMAIHLLLLAVNKVHPNLDGTVHIFSDCLGALGMVKNLPATRIPTNCSHSDILKNILVNCSSLTFSCCYSHVRAHQDDEEDFQNLTQPSQLNDCAMDYHAKKAIWDTPPSEPPRHHTMPLEPVCIFMRELKSQQIWGITSDTSPTGS